MKKTYIAPETIIVEINNRSALMTGSFNETLMDTNIEEESFTQYGLESTFSDWDEEVLE